MNRTILTEIKKLKGGFQQKENYPRKKSTEMQGGMKTRNGKYMFNSN